MPDSGSSSGLDDRSLSEELDLPEVTHLLAQAAAPRVPAASNPKLPEEGADDGLSYDGESPSEETSHQDDSDEDEARSRPPAAQQAASLEEPPPATAPNRSPSKLSPTPSKRPTQSVATTKSLSVVKTENTSPPPASQRLAPSPSKAKLPPASADLPANANPKKQKSGSTAAPVGKSDDASKPHVKSGTKKRKRADDGDPKADSAQAKKKHPSSDHDKAQSPSKKKKLPVDDLSSDIQEIPPYTPKPKAKAKKLTPQVPSASQPVRLPSASNMMAPPSPPYSTQPPSRKMTHKHSSEALSPSAPFSLPARHSRALSKAVRSTDYWYLDGSVVVWVQKTLYKLHRSSLMKRSKYFRRLLGETLPTRSQTDVDDDDEKGSDYDEEPEIVEIAGKYHDGLVEGELIDRCPVYRVTVVSTEDFEALLEAWEDGFSFAHTAPPFLTLACLLRASYALDCERVWEYASRVFTDMWPSDLASLSQPTVDQQAYAKEALELARVCGLPGVRKRAYYELVCTHGFGQVATDDNVECVDDAALELQSGSKSALSHADIYRLVATRERLQRAWVNLARAPPAPSVVPCPLGQIPQQNLEPTQKALLEKCVAARNNSHQWWMEQVVQAPLFQDGLLDPLSGLQGLMDIEWQEHGLCVGCVGARKEFWEAEMGKIWGKLDLWLGLASPAEDRKDEKTK